MTFRTLILIALTLVLGASANAQQQGPTRGTAQTLTQQIADAYRAQEWEKGLDYSERAIDIISRLQEADRDDLSLQLMLSRTYYNAACLASHAGKTDDAARYLQSAVDEGFLNVDHMESDGDLSKLRAGAPEKFQEIISSAERAQMSLAMRYPEYQFLEPSGVAEPAKAIVALPGVGQDLQAFADTMQSVANKTGRLVIMPRGSKYAGRGMFYWDESNFAGELGRIDEAILAAKSNYPSLADGQLIVLGYSQGGALAWDAGIAGEQSYQGIVTIGAYLAPSLAKNKEALARISTPAYLIMGSKETDLIVGSHNQLAQAYKAQLQRAEQRTLPGVGHEFPPNAASLFIDGIEWVETQSRTSPR